MKLPNEGESFLNVPNILGNYAVFVAGISDVLPNIGGRKIAVIPLDPGDLQRLQAPLGGPHMIAHYRHQIVENDDLLYARHFWRHLCADSAAILRRRPVIAWKSVVSAPASGQRAFLCASRSWLAPAAMRSSAVDLQEDQASCPHGGLTYSARYTARLYSYVIRSAQDKGGIAMRGAKAWHPRCWRRA
jgi:hypothetical protein